MQQLPTIGTIEQLSLKDFDLSAIPAKIDTGADNSAIWASNIVLNDGKLSCNLFAPGSMYYREKPLEFETFRTTTVRNSFGQKEFRFKIRLSVRVGKYSQTRWFTLADRSRNNYPILLGKNFLKKRFIVDVSQKFLLSSPAAAPKVLIFTKHEEADTFFASVSKHNLSAVQYDCIGYDQLQIVIDGRNTSVTNIVNGIDVSDYNFTYFKNHKNREVSASVATYLSYKSRPFSDQEFLQYMSASKLTEYMRLACFGVRVPLTVVASIPELVKQYDALVGRLGSPFVLKEIRSDRGKHNFLISSRAEFEKILSEAPDEHIYCAQQYIPNDGYYRIFITGKDPSLVVWRSATGHDDPLKQHLNKPKGSSNAALVSLDDVPGEAQDLALRAATCMNRQVCGVDILQNSQTGEWFVLEANNDPQIISGSFIPAKAETFAKYIDRELNQ